MKRILPLLTGILLLLFPVPSAIAEKEVSAQPAQAAIEAVAFTLGEESVLLSSQGDDDVHVNGSILTDAVGDAVSDPGESLIDRMVTIHLKEGVVITKVYDKTRNVTITSSSFEFGEGEVADGDRVRISKITATYDSPRAGARTVTFGFAISQTSDTYNYILKTETITVPAVITPRTITIIPTPGQGKIYGEADPSQYQGKVSGLRSGDEWSGELSREPGEEVGSYRITLGTITARSSYDEEGESSYVIDLLEGYFNIFSNSISDESIVMEPLTDQMYTGEAIEPAVFLMQGGNALTQDTDYIVDYSDNIEPGTGTVTITGIGKYTGTRTAAFRIIQEQILMLPGDLTLIDEEAFAGIGATRVIVPHGCESIGRRAFADCPSLQYIFIPGTVETIDDFAFENSPNVEIDTDALSIVEWAQAHVIPCLPTDSDPSETPSPSVSPPPD